MSDIVDSFVVSLGLDPTKYNNEIKKYRDDRKRLAQEDAKYNQQQIDGQERLAAGVKSMRNEVAGFLFVLAGANGIKDFVASLVVGDAATGRLAKNLGIATQQVSAWEGAIQRVGGSASSINGALRSMASAFQSKQLTGDRTKDADFAGLGLSYIPNDPSETLLKISEAAGRMSRPEFNARLGRLGFDEDTINLLARGRGEVTRMLEEQRKLGVVTDKDAEAAQRLQERLAMLETGIKGKLRPEIEQAVTVVGTWLNNSENLNTVLYTTVGVVGAAGIAAGIAYAPFLALATVIGLLAKNFDTSDYAMKNWSRTAKGIGQILNNDIGGGLGTLWEELKQEAGDTRDDLDQWAGVKDPGGQRAKRIAARSTRGSGSPAAAGSPSGAARIRTTNSVLATGAGGTDPEIYRVLAAKYGPQVARGITAGIKAEGGSLGMAANGAFGIGQWRGPRLKALMRKYGPAPTKAQQLEFLMSELDGGDRGGASVIGSHSAEQALGAYVNNFMRPGAGALGDMRRGYATLGSRLPAGAGGGGGSTQTVSIGQIVVYSAATDAKGIAHDMRGALAQRGIVAQANTGLNP